MFEALWREVMVCTVQDFVEILFFTVVVYYLLCWLKSDTHKNLIYNFYGYCAVLFGAHYLGLCTISYFLMYAAPLFGMFYFLIHQVTLQKNFIGYVKIKPASEQASYHWLDELFGAALHSLHKNDFFLCVLERSDSLEHLLVAPYYIHGRMSKNFLQLLLGSTSRDGMLWITSLGKVVAADARWKHAPIDEDWLAESAKTLPVWKQDALLITAKTDAVIIYVSVSTRLFTVIVEGKSIEDLTATHAHTLLQKYIPMASSIQKGQVMYAYNQRAETIVKHE